MGAVRRGLARPGLPSPSEDVGHSQPFMGSAPSLRAGFGGRGVLAHEDVGASAPFREQLVRACAHVVPARGHAEARAGHIWMSSPEGRIGLRG